MYLFPTEDSNEEINGGRVQIKETTLTLKSYGLPMIFWAYLVAILIVIGAMALVGNSIIRTMLNYDDFTLNFLAYLVISTLIIIPLVLVSFYFYEKHLVKKENEITIIHKLFFIPIFSKTIKLDQKNAFIIEHFLDSPNIAKKQNKSELRGFENKGYFELKAITNNVKITIDRCSRKADLEKIQGLLSKY